MEQPRGSVDGESELQERLEAYEGKLTATGLPRSGFVQCLISGVDPWPAAPLDPTSSIIAGVPPSCQGKMADRGGRARHGCWILAGLGVRGLRGGEFLARGRVDGVVEVG